jgi:hypothetical protein
MNKRKKYQLIFLLISFFTNGIYKVLIKFTERAKKNTTYVNTLLK